MRLSADVIMGYEYTGLIITSLFLLVVFWILIATFFK